MSVSIFQAIQLFDLDALKKAAQQKNVFYRRDKNNRTPLMAALVEEFDEGVHWLLEAGVNPNIGYSMETPLFIAARIGREDLCRSLLSHGANLDQAEKSEGFTALHNAVWEGNMDSVRLLLSLGANPNATTTAGDTALHLCLEEAPEEDVLIALLEHGGNPEAQNHEGKSPLDLARGKLRNIVLSFVEKHQLDRQFGLGNEVDDPYAPTL